MWCLRRFGLRPSVIFEALRKLRFRKEAANNPVVQMVFDHFEPDAVSLKVAFDIVFDHQRQFVHAADHAARRRLANPECAGVGRKIPPRNVFEPVLEHADDFVDALAAVEGMDHGIKRLRIGEQQRVQRQVQRDIPDIPALHPVGPIGDGRFFRPDLQGFGEFGGDVKLEHVSIFPNGTTAPQWQGRSSWQP